MFNINKLFYPLIMVTLVSFTSLSVAAENEVVRNADDEKLAKAAPAQKKPKKDPLQFVRGAKAWAKTCARCHNMKSAKDYSDEIWKVSVSHMRVRANIPGNMARDIEAFLQASNNNK